jgi:hypothetical protein
MRGRSAFFGSVSLGTAPRRRATTIVRRRCLSFSVSSRSSRAMRAAGAGVTAGARAIARRPPGATSSCTGVPVETARAIARLPAADRSPPIGARMAVAAAGASGGRSVSASRAGSWAAMAPA